MQSPVAALILTCRACERSVSGAKNGTEPAEKSDGLREAVNGSRKNERSGARSGRSRSGNGGVSGLNRLLMAAQACCLL